MDQPDSSPKVQEEPTLLDVESSINEKKSKSYTGRAPKYATKALRTWPVYIWFIMSSEFCERYEKLKAKEFLIH